MYALQPAWVHAAASPVYFSLFLSNAASMPSSHGMVNSAMMTVLVMVDQSTMSGWREVMAIYCGNFSWRSRSALRAHSPLHDSRDLSLTVLLNASPPCLTNWMDWCDAVGLALFTSSLRALMASASFRRTRVAVPPVVALGQCGQPERMCCRLGLWWPQSWQCSSVPYQRKQQ